MSLGPIIKFGTAGTTPKTAGDPFDYVWNHFPGLKDDGWRYMGPCLKKGLGARADELKTDGLEVKITTCYEPEIPLQERKDYRWLFSREKKD